MYKEFPSHNSSNMSQKICLHAENIMFTIVYINVIPGPFLFNANTIVVTHMYKRWIQILNKPSGRVSWSVPPGCGNKDSGNGNSRGRGLKEREGKEEGKTMRGKRVMNITAK